MGIVSLVDEARETDTIRATPKEFVNIKQKFQEVMDKRTPIIIESSALNLTQSIKIELEYVGDRWCMGRSTYYRYGKEEKVPYTISYADLYITDPAINTPKIIVKGANPFD